jgi:hypothetical protein
MADTTEALDAAIRAGHDAIRSVPVLVVDAPFAAATVAVRAAAPIIERDALLRMTETLRKHWLMQMVCDHEHKTDRPMCACCDVDLGVHASVGAAVNAWIEHVLARATSVGTEEVDHG